MILPHIIYDNLLRSPTLVTITGAEQVGFEKEYLCDWRDFTAFRPVASAAGTYTSSVVYTVSKATTITGWFAWMEDAAPAACTCKIEAEATAGAGYTSSIVFVGPGKQVSGGPAVVDSTTLPGWPIGVGAKIKVSFSGFDGSTGVRQVVVGPSFVAPTGQWDGVMPPMLTSGAVVENVISMNGSILARNVRRLERTMTIDLQYLPEAWVRSTWEPFAQHALRYPFIYRWNSVEWPTDVAFAAASEVNAPKNNINGKMSVSMPIKVTI